MPHTKRPALDRDPEVHHHIRTAYPELLAGHRFTLHATEGASSTCLGVIRGRERLLIIQAHAANHAPNHAQYHPHLGSEEARELNEHQYVQACTPTPQHHQAAALGAPRRLAREPRTPTMRVLLECVGSAHLWWGGGVGEIWDANLDDHDLRCDAKTLHAFWYLIETALHQRGCGRVHTLADNPDHNDADYLAFLAMREYTPDPSTAEHPHRVWTKALD